MGLSSSTDLNGAKRPRGRPRSERARQAILSSTMKLLQEVGFADLSIEAVAASARVGKPTVYRWWTSKAALVADAFISGAEMELRFPHTSVLADVRVQMSNLIRALRSRRGRIVSALIGGGQANPELLDAFQERYLGPRRREARATLQRAINKGELPADINVDILLDALYGPIYMRFLVRHDNLSDALADELWHFVIDGLIAKATLEKSNRKSRGAEAKALHQSD